MPTERIVVIGAGGHGRVVMDALLASDPQAPAIFVDDDLSMQGMHVFGRVVEPPTGTAFNAGFRFHVAIGANDVRAATIARLERAGGRLVSVVHPRATVSPRCSLDDGVFIAAGAVVGPGASIAAGSIVNHGAVVDHDCQVGACAHVAPNATLAGGVRLGSGVLIGAGANLLTAVEIGDGAVIGAGAVVLSDVPALSVHVGVPARWVKEKIR